MKDHVEFCPLNASHCEGIWHSSCWYTLKCISVQPPLCLILPPLCKYHQLWKQLIVNNGILFYQYSPSPSDQMVTVPILPAALHKKPLLCNHDSLTAGHQSIAKTLEHLQCEAYWADIAKHVEEYCSMSKV